MLVQCVRKNQHRERERATERESRVEREWDRERKREGGREQKAWCVVLACALL